MAELARKAKVLFVAFGGTISMTRDSQTSRSVPNLSAAELLEQLSLPKQLEVCCIDAPYSLRVVRQPVDLLAMARFLQSQILDDLAGVVVTHGTDALEDIVYFLDEVCSSCVPVIFTGAMRPSWAIDSDGVRNLENAFRLALVATAEDGVLVTMHGEIFEAWSVYKADTVARDAFAARRGAASGRIFEDGVELPRRRAPRTRFGVLPTTLPMSVPILVMGVGDDGMLLDRIEADALQGLVIAGMGAGSVPPLTREKMVLLAQKGIPVVLCSSVPSGPTAAERYYPGDYDEWRAAGVGIEDQLNARKTRIRLLLSLGLGLPYTPFGG